MIRHLVFLQFPEGRPRDQKNVLLDDLAGLSRHSDGIPDFQIRENISPEDQFVRGFQDMFWFDFCDTGARDAYLGDATHQGIGARLVEALAIGVASVFLCDIEL